MRIAERDMILGTGIDIVNIERIEGMMARWGEVFLGRVFTEREIIRCRERKRASECFAVRFAAKEAFLKAMGWGYRNGVRWTDIETENDPMGKPSLCFHGKAEAVCKRLGIRKALLTLSHDRPCAIAHVILED
jgi:holo-[acyl-carrier protein] synthase